MDGWMDERMNEWKGEQARLPEGVFLVLHGMDEGPVEDWGAGACQRGVAVGGAVLPGVHQPMSICTTHQQLTHTAKQLALPESEQQ